MLPGMATNLDGFNVDAGSADIYYMAVYPYESSEPGDLTFQAGELVTVSKKDGDWWTGTIGTRTGVFPSNYVQKSELQSEAAADSEVEAATNAAAAAAAVAAVDTHATADTAGMKEKRVSVF